MRIPGPRTTVILQELAVSQSGTGAITETWTTVTTFSAVIAALQPAEKAAFDKETVLANYRIFIDYADIGSTNHSKLIEENRINVPTGDMVIAAGNYDIIAVQGFQKAGHKHFELYLHKEKN